MYDTTSEQYRTIQSAGLRESYIRIPRAVDQTLRITRQLNSSETKQEQNQRWNALQESMRVDPVATLDWIARIYGR